MDKDCGNTEIAKDVIEILNSRRKQFCEFFAVLKEEFTFYCVKAALKSAQNCKNEILHELKEQHFSTKSKGNIVEYIDHRRGDIDYFLNHLSYLKLKSICW